MVPAIFFSSLAYSSVGLGGGSAYIAILYLFGFPIKGIPALSLFFNITASSTALWRFRKEGYFNGGLALPFIISSVPFAFLGASLRLNDKTLSLVLAATLALVSFLLFTRRPPVLLGSSLRKETFFLLALSVGGVLGFLAAVSGIGGGIFLAPVLFLTGLGSPRVEAATCSLFVLANSGAGFLAHSLHGRVEFSPLVYLGIAVLLGAQVGSFLGARKFSSPILRKILAGLLLTVSLKIGMELWR